MDKIVKNMKRVIFSFFCKHIITDEIIMYNDKLYNTAIEDSAMAVYRLFRNKDVIYDREVFESIRSLKIKSSKK